MYTWPLYVCTLLKLQSLTNAKPISTFVMISCSSSTTSSFSFSWSSFSFSFSSSSSSSSSTPLVYYQVYCGKKMYNHTHTHTHTHIQAGRQAGRQAGTNKQASNQTRTHSVITDQNNWSTLQLFLTDLILVSCICGCKASLLSVSSCHVSCMSLCSWAYNIIYICCCCI